MSRLYEVKISGIGSYVPCNRLTNHDLENMVETNDEWIRIRTGISERCLADSTEATSDLAFRAAYSALEDAGLKPTDIDLIIVGTETPDHIFPPVACQVQKRLGCRNIGAFDVHATCVGFVTVLQIAQQYIKSGLHKHVLIIGADTMSRITDYTDRSTCILFSDGAGAFILSQSDEPGIISTSIHSDGEFFELLYVPGGGSRYPHPVDETTKAKIVMEGNKVFKLAVRAMTEGVNEILQSTGYTKEAIDWLIPHQANQRIIDAVAKNLDFPDDKVISTLSGYGNNSSATIPLAMATAVRDGRIQRGQTLLFTAFGAGLLWGSALLKY